MKNFPSRLKAARLMKGYSMQDLAGRLEDQLSKQSISRYEGGFMKPNRETLKMLCKALDVKPEYFERDIQVSIDNVSFRKITKLSSKGETQIKLQAADFIERYLELEDIVGEANQWHDLSFPATSLDEAEVAASELRKEWNLGEDTLYNIVELLEDHGLKILEMDADISFSGLSGRLEKDHTPFIVLNVNPQIPIDRKRFTALHELGHLVLEFRDMPEKEVERLCNRFAAALLIPRSRMFAELGRNRRTIHLKELQLLKQQYGMSMQGILFRAKDLDIISDYQFRQQMMVFSQLGMRKQEPDLYKGQEAALRFLQLLCRAIAEDMITVSKGAELYNMKTAEFMDEIAKFQG
jgi:Zn-dependent peptidase ImmA (M78 family)/DNA-binding XRE family transcriptional regulator